MEFVNHLGLGHLIMEPIVVAFLNWEQKTSQKGFNTSAMIRKLLGPHMDRTLAVNFLAKHTLIGKNERLSLDSSTSLGKIFHHHRIAFISKN